MNRRPRLPLASLALVLAACWRSAVARAPAATGGRHCGGDRAASRRRGCPTSQPAPLGAARPGP